MTKSKNTGDFGEKLALGFMVSQGFRHIANNYHSKYGEIDVILENDLYIVFMEVKTRRNHKFGSGIEAVDKPKRLKIIRTALDYLSHNPSEKQPRFDVIEVDFNTQKITHYENAFSGDDYDAFF